jgi:hypothetical protein
MMIILLLVFLFMLLFGGYAVLVTMDEWSKNRKR